MRVALCLYGLVGGDSGKGGMGSSDKTLTIGYEHYRNNLIEVNDHVDVFIHTWSLDQKDQIIKLYSPTKYVFEKQIQFKVPPYVKGDTQRKNNHYSKWYSTMRSVQLKREHELEQNFKYDFVIVSRFDIALKSKFDFSQHDPEKFYVGNWCTFCDKRGKDLFKGGRGPMYEMMEKGKDLSELKHRHIGYPHDKENGFIDQWFFSGSENMDVFADLYSHLDDYTRPGKCPNDRSGRISNHRLSFYHVEQSDLLGRLDFAYHLHDDFPLVRRRFLECRV